VYLLFGLTCWTGLVQRKGQAMSDSSVPATERSLEDRQLADELVERARSEGLIWSALVAC
jgi:hypothetical protein